MRIAIAQLNLVVGDVAGNTRRVAEVARRARDGLRARVVVFPELTLTGYPPEDLLLHAGLRVQVERAVGELAAVADGIALVAGFPEWHDGALYNVAALFDGGAERARYRKQLLPNYAVFDEKRYFEAGSEPCVVEVDGMRLGLTICEDLWFPQVAAATVAAGAESLINLSASPFQIGRQEVRSGDVFARRARECGVPVVSVNLVGGQDELVFDGGSLAVAADGTVAVRAAAFEEALVPVDFTRRDGGWDASPGDVHSERSLEESVWNAVVLGTRDYVRKNGFEDVVIGLSGGVDSALAALVAHDALGAGHVHTVMMPSRYTARISIDDAAELAAALGIDHREISIEPAFDAVSASLRPAFGDADTTIAMQNLQSRTRGMMLMALSNAHHWMALATGNKSEFAVGYATLYGDMAGGYAPLKDLTKTMVYRVARWRGGIPARILERPPTAELAPDQLDQDTLPPYDVLDAIVVEHVERDRSVAELVAAGFDEAVVTRVAAMIRRNEHKRRQAPPGARVTGRAFGRDRRYPITSRFRD